MKKPTEVAPPAMVPSLRRYLYVTAALTGAAVMIVEILGAKMLSPYLGTSHFVWTAQIAVTLVALATGYASGGWLVDRSPRLTWIYLGVLGAALYLCFAVLGCERVAYACLRYKLAAGSFLASLALFFVPLSLLAMVGPFFVRVLTVSVSNVGRNVGRLTCLSTLGSVGGTILIGYVLIPLFPNSMTMYLTAAVLLATAGAYFVVWERKLAVPAVILVLVGGGLGYLGAARPTLSESAGMTELYRANSNFGLLQVMDEKVMKRRVYLNDLLTQNTYNPGTGQSDSLFTYMLHDLARAYAAEVRTVLCIGMGVGIVPRQFAREGVKVDVVEINPAVAPLATRFFDFRPEQVNLLIGDGRYWVNQPGPAYDAIILDAFLGESPPAHLMTREAFAAMKRRLRPGGVLVMNSFGEFRAGRDFLTASLERTLRLVFPSLRVHAAGNGNVFYVASDQRELRLLHPPDFADMPEGLRYLANLAMEGTMQTDATHGRVLTDDYNPVEFYDAANREELRRRLALSYQPSDND